MPLREEHRKRAKSCPFLAHSSGSGSSSATQTMTASQTTNKLTRSTSAKPPSKVQAKPPSRSRSSRQTRGHKELVIVTENHSLEEGEEEEEEGVKPTAEEIEDEIPTVRLVQKPAEAQRTRKSSRAPSARPSTRGVTRAAPQPIPDTEGKSQGRSKALKDVQEGEESSDEIGHCISEKEETGQQLAPSRPRALRKPTKARAKSTSRRKQEEVITQDESEDLGASNRRTLKGRSNRVVEETDAEDEEVEREGAHVEKESGTDTTREEGNATNYGMSEQEDEEERRAPSRSRSTTKASKRSSRAPSANASRRKKGANGARERAEEETHDEDDSNRDDINLPTEDQSEPDEEDPTPAPSRSRALRKSAKARNTSSRKKNKASSADELISKHKNQKNRVTSGDDVVGDDDTVHFSKPGNEEERTPVQRPRVPISEKFKPVRSPRKEVQGLDSVKPAVVVETTSPPVVVEKGISIQDATPPPTELLALNFENTSIVEERTAVVPGSLSQSSVPTVETPPSSSPALLAMTVEATTPEPQILAPPTMTAKATTPEPQVLSALPIMTANATAAEPQTFPALSRIPFMPLQMLTDAELDMTVEEWIRYQMEIEYDKLKRDGERELARFKARAVEARRIIESL